MERRGPQSALIIVLAALFLLTPNLRARAAGEAQSQRTLPAVHASPPPLIDGDLSDAAWKSAAVTSGFADEFTRSTNIDQTEACLCYDDQAIYVAFLCCDAQPAAIVAREIRRDANFQGEDTVTFLLDPFNSRRDGDINWFTVNALGTCRAWLAGGRAQKPEWQGDWTAAARRTDTGWTAEMRIPWQMVNFPAGDGARQMGINFLRRQERTKVVSHWSYLGTRYRYELQGAWPGVAPPRTAFRPTLSLLPYSAPGYTLGRGRRLRGGLDARFALTPELTAVATASPDFASVEQAVAGIEFSRGERFLPETRPFFLEGRDTLDTSGGSRWGQAFFSRRIPEFDVGAKVYGRLGSKSTIGFLGTLDFGHRFDMVARLARDMGPNSYIGGYLVQRTLPGDHNTILGVNESVRRGNWSLRSHLARSLGDQAGGNAISGSVRWDTDCLGAELGYTHVDPDFRAANGFVPFVDYRGWNANIRYHSEWRSGLLQSLSLFAGTQNQDRIDGRFFRQLHDFSGFIQTRSDWGFRFGWSGGRFEDERDSEFSLGFTKNLSNRFRRWGIGYSFGTRANRPISFLTPQCTFRILGGWDMGISASFLSHVEKHQQIIFSLNRELDAHRALGGQIIAIDGRATFFVSYRISGGRGMETYFLIGDPDPNRRPLQHRLLTKFVWPM
ncbi:MAG: carbohydrate binding family 9 domain-containing protein [Armatimonadetes bacterium]|nr:carbohydrate binding family 9 domain-containing protein [Armatimonadota bacterium]